MSAATTKCWEGIAKCLPLCSLWDRINSVGIKLQFTILIFIQTQRLADKEAYTHAHATFKSCSQYIQQLILACAAVGRCVLSSQPKGLKTVIRIAFSIIQFHPTFTKSGSTYLKLFLYCRLKSCQHADVQHISLQTDTRQQLITDSDHKQMELTDSGETAAITNDQTQPPRVILANCPTKASQHCLLVFLEPAERTQTLKASSTVQHLLSRKFVPHTKGKCH